RHFPLPLYFSSPPPPHTPTLSLHDALPISPAAAGSAAPAHDGAGAPDDHPAGALADDLAAPHHDPTGAPVSATAHADDHAASAADRKSTRLNSSHVAISYAVFCLKKKKQRD